MLAQYFAEAVMHYCHDQRVAAKLWSEIEKHYTSKKRYYHTLTHLENLVTELWSLRNCIEDWDCILFSIAYHDIIYNTLNKDNEEKSAAFAAEQLRTISFPGQRIDRCVAQILATKSHAVSEDSDANLFTDSDLSVLGSDWNVYDQYARNIRKEYSFYPDLLYKPGRKKVLQHFLSMERIFKTEQFFSRFEDKARKNLLQEFETLSES
jgi:predicted metal-dependent HD superfamily phosphohydrolase